MGRGLGPALRGRATTADLLRPSGEKMLSFAVKHHSKNKLQFEGEEDLDHRDLKALVWDFWESIPSLFPGL